ncbi:MAG: hypothetical protein ACJ74M_09015 [Gaiellaceae bacterium]|jgi:hypothetical protein
MLRFRKPPLSLVVFLLTVVAIGALVGHLVNAVGLAAFFFFVAGIDPKPAWTFWYGKPGNQYDGKGWRFNSWQRVGMTSPKEMRQAPDLKN